MSELNSQFWVVKAHPLEQSLVLLAHEGFAMMTGDVVPVDSISVEVVEQSQTVLSSTVLFLFTIVWLGKSDSAKYVFGKVIKCTMTAKNN